MIEHSPEQDALKSAAITIANDIIEAGTSDNRVLHIMEHLGAFGDRIISKIEKNDPSTKADCSSGCSYCCHMQVKLTPPEAFYILQNVSTHFNLTARHRLFKRIDNNRSLTEGKTLAERILIKHQTPCVFLTNHMCDIYQARPLICHAWHALDKRSCLTAYQSQNANAEIETAPSRNYVYSMIREAIEDICVDMHWECGIYELPFLMDRCLHLEHPLQNWLVGRSQFDVLEFVTNETPA